jgi:hypothetical protein
LPNTPYPRWQHRHESVLLWLFENPTKTLGECAKATGYSPTHLSRITRSPDFLWHYEDIRQLQEELVSEIVAQRLSVG